MVSQPSQKDVLLAPSILFFPLFRKNKTNQSTPTYHQTPQPQFNHPHRCHALGGFKNPLLRNHPRRPLEICPNSLHPKPTTDVILHRVCEFSGDRGLSSIWVYSTDSFLNAYNSTSSKFNNGFRLFIPKQFPIYFTIFNRPPFSRILNHIPVYFFCYILTQCRATAARPESRHTCSTPCLSLYPL